MVNMTTVVLSGEGSRGVYQYAVLEYLISKGLEVKKLYGISSGALVSALVSQIDPPAIRSSLSEIKKIGDIFKFNPFFPFGSGFYTTSPLERTFRRLLKHHRLPLSHRKPAVVSYVDYQSGQITYKDISTLEDEDLISAVLSAVSIPGLISPYKAPYVDAGCMEINPVTYAISQGENDIAVIIGRPSSPVTMKPASGLFKGLKIAYRALDLMMHSMCMDDMLSGALAGRGVDIQLFEPLHPLADTLDFTKSKDMYSLGVRGRYRRTDVVKAMKNLS